MQSELPIISDIKSYLSKNPKLLAEKSDSLASVWFDTRTDIHCYVRMGSYFLVTGSTRTYTPCLVISNVCVVGQRHKGTYNLFLEQMYALSKQYNAKLVIESVSKKDHYGIYLRRGFSMVRSEDYACANFIKD